MKHRTHSKQRAARKRLAGPSGAVVLVLTVLALAAVLSKWKPWERSSDAARVQSPAATRPMTPSTPTDNAAPNPTVGATNAPAATNDVDALQTEGTALLYKGDAAGAVTRYQQAMKLKPDDEEIHFNLALAFARLGNTNEAIRYYNEALKILPDYAEAHNNLGNLLVGLRKHSEALEHYSAALKVNPENSSALNNIGRCLAELGQAKEAVAQFTEAIRLNPEYLEAHFNLAVAQFVQGNLDEAINGLEKVLRMQPGFVPAQAMLERVKAKKTSAKGP